MLHAPTVTPALTVALALAAGVVAETLARHLNLPGIVLLLAAGVLLGPEFADVVRPASLGGALQPIVGFAVAVILFEGGLNLDLRRLRREGSVIRGLVTVGALVTAVGGTLAARAVMGWGWSEAVLFGVLVIVTGPTVVTPLVRRIGLVRNLRTILEAEGVFIDAVGALVAVVTLEIVVQPGRTSVLAGAASLGMRLGGGLLAGLLGGGLIALLLRIAWAVPEGLENVLSLSLVLALFQGSNALLPESGILAVIVAGLVVGNVRTNVQRTLMEFKEQLTVMLVGMLFVLLAADVRLSQVRALGVRGLATVGLLMFAVRPATVLASTVGAGLRWREKVFLSWLAPRGIVAAAVASLFLPAMAVAGMERGGEIRALVFLVIGATVVVQGITSGPLGSLLGLRHKADAGFVILGANPLGRLLGRVLRAGGEEVLFIDPDPQAVRAAEEDGFRALYGRELDQRLLRRSAPETRRGYLAVTTHAGVNLLFARKVREEWKAARAVVALHRSHAGVEPLHVKEAGAATLFGAQRDLDLWIGRCAAGAVDVERWRAGEPPAGAPGEPVTEAPDALLLPLALRRGPETSPVDDGSVFRLGDGLVVAIAHDRGEEGRAWLLARGWLPIPAEEPTQGPIRSPRKAHP